MSNRYFFFTYIAEMESQAINGSAWMECSAFPSNQEVKSTIINMNPSFISVVVTGWQEFASKEDYDNFCGEKE